MHTTDTWKYNHHSIKTLTVTPVGRIIKATKNLATEIQCHNNAPQDKLEAIEHLRSLITGRSAPINRQTTDQQVKPPAQHYLQPEHISELMAPVGNFEPPTFVPQPTPVNDNEHAPEVLFHKEDEETHVQNFYNLLPWPKLVSVVVSPVHIQPPRVYPSLTSNTILPNITRLRSRVAISNYDIDISLIPSIKV